MVWFSLVMICLECVKFIASLIRLFLNDTACLSFVSVLFEC